MTSQTLNPVHEMWATEEPLAVRIRTHQLYTRPAVDFMAWVLDHVSWRGDETVVDVGCGAGAYVEPACARLIGGGRLFSLDLSPGMLRDVAAKSLAGSFDLLNADAMSLPLPDACCDVALANHVLFDVPDIERALVEIRRVLRPGGVLLAAANARDSMEGFFVEITAACRRLGFAWSIPTSPLRTRFTLENGGAQIEAAFPVVRRDVLDSALVFPETAPAVAYIHSMRHAYAPQLPDGLSWDALMAQTERQITAKITADGAYRVSKTTGVFLARK